MSFIHRKDRGLTAPSGLSCASGTAFSLREVDGALRKHAFLVVAVIVSSSATSSSC